jgi:hypothetical protein
MGRVEDVEAFRALLSTATGAVGRDYFLLPVADAEGREPIVQYRERVYAYELYHRLRCVWPEWPYSLGGEVDKQGSPIFRDLELDQTKPDLLVHVPGAMDQNLVVVEIKAAGPTSQREAIETDLKKLAAFCAKAEYAAGFLLVFGEQVERIFEHVGWAVERGASLQDVELWHHSAPGSVARRLPWRVAI